MSDSKVMSVLDQVENLPTLPVVAQQILKLVGNPRSNMSQIAAIIAKDQAISARVVRLVNSAYYGLIQRVSSIRNAIVILGVNTVKNLVLGVSVIRTFEEQSGTSIFDRDQFWVHAFSTAMAARAIAEEKRLEEPEDFFLAGLLHDIGILAVDQFLHDEFVSILDTSLQNGQDFLNAEKSVIGATHAEVGGFLGEKWGIPSFLIHAIRHHHEPMVNDPKASEQRGMICVVHVADVKTRQRGIGRFVQRFPAECSGEALSNVGLPSGKYEALLDGVENESKALVREWGL